MPFSYQQNPQVGVTPIDVLNNYFISLYPLVINTFLSLLAAIVVFLIGWLIAMFIKLVLEFLLSRIQLREWFNSIGLGKYIEDFSWEDKFDKVVAEIVFWVILLIFVMTSFDILGLSTINSFLRDFINYLPKAITGGLILFTGFLFGELTRKALVGVLRGIDKKSAYGVSVFIKWAIIIFAFFAALSQWGVAVEIVNSLVMGVVLFVAIAGGLAFGLGGQESAREVLDNLKRHFK
jgi:hypothetical protein